jgi:hypothetical protein
MLGKEQCQCLITKTGNFILMINYLFRMKLLLKIRSEIMQLNTDDHGRKAGDINRNPTVNHCSSFPLPKRLP